jgi:hypothetical protein
MPCFHLTKSESELVQGGNLECRMDRRFRTCEIFFDARKYT